MYPRSGRARLLGELAPTLSVDGLEVAVLYGVGYQQRDLASFVGLLRLHGVRHLVDVRLTPASRKPGFSKTRLSATLAEAGIDYSHVSELGNPRDNRDAFRAGASSAVRRYRSKLDNGSRHAVEALVDMAQEQPVAMLCYERDQAECHRRIIAEVAQEIDPGLVVIPLE